METIFATQEIDGNALFRLYDFAADFWADIEVSAATWADVTTATSVWTDL